MLDYLSSLWPWLAACLALGAATGALARDAAPRRRIARWLLWFGAAFAAGLAALSFGAVEGMVAAGLESALACFLVFALGAAGVAALRGTLGAHEKWALGLLPLLLLWFGLVQIAAPAYEAQVRSRVAALAQAAGADPAGLDVAGRDVVAPAAIAGNAALMAKIEAAPGVRRVRAKSAAPARAENRPQEAPATPAAPPPAALAEDAAACQRALDALAAAEPVLFRRARDSVDRRAARALDKAAETIRRCPETRIIELRGHAGAGAANMALALRRAQAAERYLREEGVAGRKIAATACCAAGQDARRGAGAIDYILR